MKGKIVESDQDEVLVETEETRIAVRRRDVVDIHHPGTAAVGLGGFFLLGGATTAVASGIVAAKKQRHCNELIEAGGWLPGSCLTAGALKLLSGAGAVTALIAGGVLYYGISIKLDSKRAAEAPRPRVAPVFWIERRGASLGVAAQF